MTSPEPTCPVAIRSYGPDSTTDRHDFAQIVLPLSGSLAMDIAGRESLIDRGMAAFVPPGARHDQTSPRDNRSIILDLHPGDLDGRALECLARRPYILLAPEAAGLVDYMEALAARGRVDEHRRRLWLPLLVEALLGDVPQPRPRLAVLCARVEARLSRDWTVAAMAREAGVSASRLHALFQSELGSTPRAWLSGVRLARARHLLARTALPIAEVAYRCGYADQSALTRALRNASGATPAAYRRQAGVQA